MRLALTVSDNSAYQIDIKVWTWRRYEKIDGGYTERAEEVDLDELSSNSKYSCPRFEKYKAN
jgi:hypothetical protein